jgi:hypothetical protein
MKPGYHLAHCPNFWSPLLGRFNRHSMIKKLAKRSLDARLVDSHNVKEFVHRLIHRNWEIETVTSLG